MSSSSRKETTILILAYYSLIDPVFQSAVLAYFLRVSEIDHIKVVLLTFENDRFPMSHKEKEEWRKDLFQKNIIWKHLYWHSGKFKPVKKVYDLIVSFLYSARLIFKFKIDSVYSEGFPGAILGHFIASALKKKHIIHTFEPHADYMLEGGVWSNKSWEYQLLKKSEIMVAKGASSIITATENYRRALKAWNIKADIAVIPSCIDTNIFFRSVSSRDRIRQEYGLNESDKVLVYLGKIGGMYMDNELFDFFAHCEKSQKDFRFHYWFFTNAEPGLLIDECAKRGLAKSNIRIANLIPSEVSDNLSACDIGIVAIKPIPARRFSSPIKTGEYWACGLPVIIPAGVSDDYEIVQREDVGAVLTEFSKSLVNWDEIFQISPERCREIAIKYRSLDGYMSQFKNILNI